MCAFFFILIRSIVSPSRSLKSAFSRTESFTFFVLVVSLLEDAFPSLLGIRFGTVSKEPQPVTKYCCTAWKPEETIQYRTKPEVKFQPINRMKNGITNCIVFIVCILGSGCPDLLLLAAGAGLGCEMRNDMNVAIAAKTGRIWDGSGCTNESVHDQFTCKMGFKKDNH